MDSSKLDKYLDVIEGNSKEENSAEKCSVFLKDLDDNVSFRKLTRSEIRDVTFNMPYATKCFADIYKLNSFKKTIYNCCELAEVATKAKEKGLIKTYYDVIDYLFSPNDIATLWLAIMKENKIGGDVEVDDLKN